MSGFEGATTYRYSLRFDAPFAPRSARRVGTLLVARRGDGTLGIGELATWTAFDGIPHEAAEAELHRALRADATSDCAPVAWCLASAREPWHDATQSAAPQVASAALVWADSDADFERAVRDLQAGDGPAAIKLKIGREAPAVDAARIETIRALFPDAELRLDANRRLAAQDVIRLAKSWEDMRIDYWEEPCPRLEEVLTVARAGIPVALDESLVAGSADDTAIEAATALVLKPSLLGDASSEYARRARALGTRVVISSVFESYAGRRILTRFAARVAPGERHGLGTGRFLADDFEAHELEGAGASSPQVWDAFVESGRLERIENIGDVGDARDVGVADDA